MKKLILQLIIPLTLLSFAFITKWWYADIVDGSDEILIGFPLPYTCPCWHTSLCSQFFVMEFFVDLFCYFLLWFIIVFLVNNYLIKLKLNKALTITLYCLTILLSLGNTILAFNTEYVIRTKRNVEINILETGYQFMWQNIKQPNYDKYHLKKLP